MSSSAVLLWIIDGIPGILSDIFNAIQSRRNPLKSEIKNESDSEALCGSEIPLVIIIYNLSQEKGA